MLSVYNWSMIRHKAVSSPSFLLKFLVDYSVYIPGIRPWISSSVQASREFLGNNLKIFPGLNNIYKYLPTHPRIPLDSLCSLMQLLFHNLVINGIYFSYSM